MTSGAYTQLLDLACGVLLLCAVVVLWQRELAVLVRVLAVQGAALAAIAAVLGVHERRWGLLVVAAGVGVLRAGVLPYLLRRALGARTGGAADPPPPAAYRSPYREDVSEARETRPVVNVAASLVTAALLTLLAYAAARPLVALHPTPATRALPVGLAVVLVGFFVLVARRRAIAQVVGFLTLDNGITATAFLAASGVPPIVELGVSFDVLLAVLVLHVLTTRMRAAFGGTDLDDLRELSDR
ncbi:hypothetical protein [Actinacidiphila bryophytorum]|uniref:Hydrogenase-4 component E n=1 Tax=Actinacidiphila bryophytorum TaxID=1436133 RepID=A0A9W4GYP2_9ACTN|nr:hypothetical protein [Actinacidiphila bryophytorum]MBM9437911.1 hypothetical protein [Actinacidiphila bryophytorum]MBN6546489.1 hypothetical protein [Actinacidiphila bryophytorum]CAG7623244.1 Hydrogenase-4 component E [Actinacidiphila bryophytorum]